MTTTLGQILSWIKDESIHGKDGACCPDFSCCLSEEKRIEVSHKLKIRYLKAYAESDPETMMKIASMFYTELSLPEILIFPFDHEERQ
jgi:hypothetical protein